mgnify:FL=1
MFAQLRSSYLSGCIAFHDVAFFIPFSETTRRQNIVHIVAAVTVCLEVGKTMNVNPCPFTMAEKLDTQNGMKKKRKICHWLRLVGVKGKPVVLKSRPKPIIVPMPSEVSQSVGDLSLIHI